MGLLQQLPYGPTIRPDTRFMGFGKNEGGDGVRVFKIIEKKYTILDPEELRPNRKEDQKRIGTEAQVWIRRKNFERAIELLEYALEEYPKSTVFATRLITAYAGAKNLGKAEEIYRRFERKDDCALHMSMLTAYYSLKLFEKGLELIHGLMDEREDDVGGNIRIRIMKAEFLRKMGRQANAIKTIDNILENATILFKKKSWVFISSEHERWLLCLRAYCLLESGHKESAAAEFRELERIVPHYSSSRPRVLRGMLLSERLDADTLKKIRAELEVLLLELEGTAKDQARLGLALIDNLQLELRQNQSYRPTG